MKDQNSPNQSAPPMRASSEPVGSLQRALYLWERQPPRVDVAGRTEFKTDPIAVERPDPQAANPSSSDGTFNPAPTAESPIEDQLKRQAGRLHALERVIPGDRRLDAPRFSLMMLNAFLGRTVLDGTEIARLPGLISIADRIDRELSDLELDYPAARDMFETEPEPTADLVRAEMRSLFSDLQTTQKAQHRQVLSSLTALHTALSDLRALEPTRPSEQAPSPPHGDDGQMPPPTAQIHDLARPLVDPARLVDPRPILAAARSAASRAQFDDETARSGLEETAISGSEQRPYRSAVLGSALIGILILLFGRDAVQFLSASHTPGLFARP